jgi:hypothetical protein
MLGQRTYVALTVSQPRALLRSGWAYAPEAKEFPLPSAAPCWWHIACAAPCRLCSSTAHLTGPPPTDIWTRYCRCAGENPPP